MYWICICVCREQATLRIYIQRSYLVFSKQCLFTWINEPCYFIHTVMRWAWMKVFRAHCFSWRCTIQFCLSFPLFAWYKKKQTRIFIRHSPFTGYLFLFLFLGFFSAWVNIFCSSDIVRIHHVFSLVVYIIFPFSSDPSLIYRFVYEYV